MRVVEVVNIGAEQRAVGGQGRLHDRDRAGVLNTTAAVVAARSGADDAVVEQRAVGHGRRPEVGYASPLRHRPVAAEGVAYEGVVRTTGLLARDGLRPRRLTQRRSRRVELALECSSPKLRRRVVGEGGLRDRRLAARRMAGVTLGGLILDGATLRRYVSSEVASGDGDLPEVVVVDRPTSGRGKRCVVQESNSAHGELRTIDDGRATVHSVGGNGAVAER